MNNLSGSQPYFIYQRLTLINTVEHFLQSVDFGFDYLLRNLIVKYPEVDAAGATFGPDLSFTPVNSYADMKTSNFPVPFGLVATPGSAGVQVNAAAQMTATGPKNQKKFNVVFPYRDRIHIEITGQNGTTPVLVDIVLVGYLIPNRELSMWGGNTNGIPD